MKTRSVRSEIAIIIGCIIVAAFFCPFVLEKCFFGGDEYTAIDSREWIGFLGSFIGGIIGAIGALITIIFTTRETREIQEENEAKLLEDRKKAERKERKAFGDEIALTVARYITDIRGYFEAHRMIERINKDIENYKEEREEVRQSIDIEYGGIDETYTDFNIERYLRRIEYLTSKIEEKEREKEKYITDKKTAVECYFYLQIKLTRVKSAWELLEKLEYIQREVEQTTQYDSEWINQETTSLKELTVDFIEKYV